MTRSHTDGQARRRAAITLAVIMVFGAVLHAYWAMGGTWLLPTIMNAPSGELPPDIVSGSIAVVLWILAGIMLTVAVLSPVRAYGTKSQLIQKICVVGLWCFSLLMLAFAVFNILGSQSLGRLVLAPIYLLTGTLTIYLALPPYRGHRASAYNGDTRRYTTRFAKRVIRITSYISLFVITAAGILYFVYLPWNLRWGATDEEVNRALAGDAICADANFNPTRAVTINAPPEDVWSWIIQIGYKRAGFYSYDFIDNAGIPSATHIISEYQNVKVGDYIPLDSSGGLIVREMEPNSLFVLASESGFLTWTWDLRETGPRKTRVVSRVRARLGDTQMKFIWNTFEFFMMWKCLLGINKRVEYVN